MQKETSLIDLLGGYKRDVLTNNINFYFSLGPCAFDDISSPQDTTLMKSEYIIMSIAFFSQTAIGVLGNSFLLCFFILIFLSGHRMRPIDAIITQLALVNCFVLLSKGVPKTMIALGLIFFLDKLGCDIIFYLYKVARDLSISMTCLLSGFQAITISPRNSKWAALKVAAQKYLIPSSLFCWTFHLLFCMYTLGALHGQRPIRNITEIQNYGYCFHIMLSGFQAFLFAAIISIPDVFFLIFMFSASGYMLILLYRHHKQVKQAHLTCLSPRAFPETKATKTTLLLVSTFISSYLVNCILTTYMSFVKSPPWLLYTSAFLAAYFPTVSPYVLIISDSQIFRYLYALYRRKEKLILTR